MATIEDVVKIDINRETSTVTLRDLQTMLILTEHEAFTEDYRIYTEARQMLEDGFKVDDKAYKAASKAFSQDPRPAKVMIGRKGVGESYVDAIVRQQGANSKFFYLITDAKDDTDKEAISDYVETQNRMFYAFSDKNPDTATAAETDIFSKLKAKGHLKTIGMWYQNDANEMIEAGYVARFSSEIIGSAVWIYKPLSGFVAEKVTPTQKTHLFSKNANYYTNVEDDSVVFGEGKAVGGEWFDYRLVA